MLDRFLKKLQDAEEPEKRKWAALIVALIMMAVVVLWMQYLDFVVAPDDGPGEASGFSFIETMRAGAGMIYDRFFDMMRGLGVLFKSSGEYLIKPD